MSAFTIADWTALCMVQMSSTVDSYVLQMRSHTLQISQLSLKDQACVEENSVSCLICFVLLSASPYRSSLGTSSRRKPNWYWRYGVCTDFLSPCAAYDSRTRLLLCGLVRSRNVLNTMMMSLVLMAIVGVTWVLWGYSLAFSVTKDTLTEAEAGLAGSWTICWESQLGRSKQRCLWCSRPHWIRWNNSPPGVHGVSDDVRHYRACPHFQGVLITYLFAGVETFVILKVLGAMMDLRVSPEIEEQGLDVSEHGEEGYGEDFA